jgi:hypothetical protein
VRKKIKQVYWKFFNKCLPINKQKPPTCPHDQHPDDHHHFALNCALVPIIQNQAIEVIRDLTNKPFNTAPLTTLLLKGNSAQENIFNAIIFWIQWISHNNWTHDDNTIPTIVMKH